MITIFTFFSSALVLAVLLALCQRHALRMIITDLSTPRTTTLPRPWYALLIPECVTIHSEIEALRRAEAEQRTRYKILTENAAAAVVLHDSKGTIFWCSPFTEVLTGYPLSTIYRERDSFLRSNVHEDDRDTLERALAIVSTGEPFQSRYRFYHRSSLILWLETRTVPILDPESGKYTALSITIDVTAQVAHQNQMQERNRDLHEFTYMLSHDLKGPISTIQGMLEILRAEPHMQAPTPETTQALEYIARATHRLERLVSGVLELAATASGERTLEPVDTNRVLNEITEDYQPQYGAVGGELAIEADVPPVLGNHTQLYQILSNLVGNALKYRTPERPLRVQIAAQSTTSPRKVAFTVTDNGRGIRPEALESIFKPFNRAGEEAIEGTGVGLACVKRLVERLGGTLRVESAVGTGSTFTIELRRAERAAAG